MGRLIGQRGNGQLVPVYVDREGDGQGSDIVELVLSRSRGCLGREIGARLLLGEEYRSEAEGAEKVCIEYGVV